jgi:hypothetical protein
VFKSDTYLPSSMNTSNNALGCNSRDCAVWGRVITVVVLLSAIPLLGACTQNVLLVGNSEPTVAHGTLTINMQAPHSIDIELDGHSYHGEWQSVPKKLSAMRAIQDKTSRHYQAVASGLVSSPIVEVSSVLECPNEQPLKCEWIRHYDKVDGACSLPDGRVWKLLVLPS